MMEAEEVRTEVTTENKQDTFNYKRLLLILLCLFLLRGFIAKRVHRTVVAMAGDSLSEQQISFYLEQIGKAYRPGKSVTCTLLTTDLEDLEQMGYDRAVFKDMGSNQRYILLSNPYEGKFGSGDHVVEVYGVFESYVFLKEKEYPFEIAAITWGFNSRGKNPYLRNTVTPEVFEDLYTRYIGEGGGPRWLVAQTLASKWIEEVGYIE